MNASAYLKGQGWRGEGFSLDKTDKGLSKPLLVSQKADQSGLGTKKNDFSEQWWNSAFDKSLKSIGSGAGTPAVQAPAPPTKHSGLYSKFVRSATLEGTFTPPELEEPANTAFNKMAPLPEGGVRLTTMPILGEYGNEAAPQTNGKHAETNGGQSHSRNKKEKNKKRKKSDEHETPNGTVDHKSKRSKHSNYGTNGGLPHDVVEDTSGGAIEPAQHQAGVPPTPIAPPRKEKKKKEKPKEVRARKNRERAAAALESGHRKKEKKAAEKAEAIAAGTYVEPPPDPETILTGPPHEDSVMAKRQAGQKVDLPGDPGDPDALRSRLIGCYERGDTQTVKRVLSQAYPTIDPNDPAQNGGQMPTKKISVKGAKYEREKAKREAKRDARHWVEVRRKPHIYRPDGTKITLLDLGVPLEEIQAKRNAQKDEKKRKKAEKVASTEYKEEQKVEKRAAKKMRHAEKKRQNHMAMQAHISAKIKKQKDEVTAQEQGKTYDELVEERAQQFGVSTDEYMQNGKKLLDDKATEERKEARADANPGGATDEDVNSDSASSSELDAASSASNDNDTSAEALSNGADFIPLSTDGAGFMIDTAGDPSAAIDPNAPKLVKEMTKTERRARLEEMRRRRAERQATEGVVRMSKKARRRVKAQKKEEKINGMTNDLLAHRKRLAQEKGELVKAQGRMEQKEERKGARRAARGIARRMKKGTANPDEILPQWEKMYKRKTPKLRGNGGREPKRPGT